MGLWQKITGWFKSKKWNVLRGNCPKGTIYNNPEKGVCVVHVPAGKRMVFVQGKLKPVCLYFPEAYFFVYYVESHQGHNKKQYAFASLSVGFTRKPITSPDEYLYNLPLPNLEDPEGHKFCLGTGRPVGIYNTIRQVVEAGIGAFWASAFSDYLPAFYKHDQLSRGNLTARQLARMEKNEQFCHYEHPVVELSDPFEMRSRVKKKRKKRR